MRETWVQTLGREDPLEKEMATHSSTLSPGTSYGQRSLASYSPWGHTRQESDTTEQLHFHLIHFTLYKGLFPAHIYNLISWTNCNSQFIILFLISILFLLSQPLLFLRFSLIISSSNLCMSRFSQMISLLNPTVSCTYLHCRAYHTVVILCVHVKLSLGWELLEGRNHV